MIGEYFINFWLFHDLRVSICDVTEYFQFWSVIIIFLFVFFLLHYEWVYNFENIYLNYDFFNQIPYLTIIIYPPLLLLLLSLSLLLLWVNCMFLGFSNKSFCCFCSGIQKQISTSSTVRKLIALTFIRASLAYMEFKRIYEVLITEKFILLN